MADVDVVEGSDGSEITFQNGRAIEQTTEGEVPDGDHGDERAAAMAAVKEVLEAEGKKAAKEAKEARAKDPLVPRDRGPDGKFLVDDPVEAEKEAAVKKLQRTAEDPDASALRRALADRRDAAKYKAEANAELERSRTEVRQFHAQLQREKAEVDAQRQQMAMFRKDPIRAIRENGWDNPEEFILDIAQDGTPEGQARRQHREMQAQIKEMRDWKDQQAEHARQQHAQQQQAQQRQYRQQIEQEMLKTAFVEEQHPHLVSFYKGHEVSLIAEADVVAEQYRAVTGKEASFAEIAEYLEERAAKWYKSMGGKGNATNRAPQAGAQIQSGRPTQGSATGKKSLGPAGSSERRTLGTNIADLDGEDRLEAARTAVRAAFHASGER